MSSNTTQRNFVPLIAQQSSGLEVRFCFMCPSKRRAHAIPRLGLEYTDHSRDRASLSTRNQRSMVASRVRRGQGAVQARGHEVCGPRARDIPVAAWRVPRVAPAGQPLEQRIVSHKFIMGRDRRRFYW